MRRVAIFMLLVALGASACAPDGLAFRVDERVTIVEPSDRATVTLPLTIAWEVEDFEIVPPGTPVRDGAGYFAVFIDRAPIGPGEPVPDELPVGVFTTTETTIVVERLPRSSANRPRRTATIILLDGAGHRIGESAFQVTFEVEEP